MSPPNSLTNTFHRDTYPAIWLTKPSLSQAGRTVLITGGGRGIGFEIARSFAKASASRIILVGRRTSVLEEAVEKLRKEFISKDNSAPTTEFISRLTDLGTDSSISALWDFLNSRNIFVRVLVLNAAHVTPWGPDTLEMDKQDLMEAFDVNVGGNFLMAKKFVKQVSRPLRPTGPEQLNLINISTVNIHMMPLPNQTPYATSKSAFTTLIGRIADERPVEDVQIISFNPGALYSETAANFFEESYYKWDEMALPADYAVWATSPEASWLHGRFVWAHWDVDELKAEILKRLQEEKGFLRVAVQGLPEFDFGGLRVAPYTRG